MSSLVSKITTDDTTPIPLFSLKELSDQTQRSVKDCETIRSALLNRLGKTSPDIKVKALRAIKYLCTHGRIDFKMAFQRDNSSVKALTSFVCKPDELRGEKPAENVRQEAQECMEAIYSETTGQEQQIKVESLGNTPMPAQHYQNNNVHMSASSSQYGGFGSQPQRKVPQDSFTGLNLRRTIGAFLVGESEQAHAQRQAGALPSSQYGGLSSSPANNQSSYSHYTHTPQQNQYQGNSSSNDYSQNGIYGGGSPQGYESAQAQGYATHTQSSQYATPGLNAKTGPWGKPGAVTAQPVQQSYQQQPQSLPPEQYTAKVGPSTKSSVEELGFEKRIIAQYTTNTPLKPNLSDAELKKFTQDSSACGIDDILNLLYTDIISQYSALPVPSVNKAVQLYYTIISACGMVTMEENTKEHIEAIYNVYTSLNNKHTKVNAEKVLVLLGLMGGTTATNNTIPGFVAPPQQQVQFGSNTNEDFMGMFGGSNTNPAPQQSSQKNNNDLTSSFNFMSIDEKTQQQPTPKKQMFGGLQLKSKNQTQTQQQQHQTPSFDFMNTDVPQQPPPQQQPHNNNDLMSLLGPSNTSNNNGGLNFDALYNTPAPQQKPAATNDIFANMAPAQKPATQNDAAFDFMSTSTQANNEDIFGDLLSGSQSQAAPKPVAQPVQEQKKISNQFDFLEF